MPKIAKLAIQSNLPQLDRLFDYLVPDNLTQHVEIGSRVRVIFGRSKKPLDAFIVDFPAESEFSGRLNEVLELVGPTRTLTASVFRLCQQLAERSASTLGDVLKLAVPPHMPRAYAGYEQVVGRGENPASSQHDFLDDQTKAILTAGNRSFVLAEPRQVQLRRGQGDADTPAWARDFVLLAGANLQLGRSTLILVPDYREHEVIMQALASLGLSSQVANYSQEQVKSKQYLGFLSALENEPRIVVGSRAAAFAPAHNLGGILVFDEADRSYSDAASPYLHTRDVVLVRQSVENCPLVFSSHSVSSDMKRLIDSGFLTDRTQTFASPRISNSEPGLRVDSHAYSAIKAGLELGPVLVQVSSLGDSTSVYCKSCDEPARCRECQGPLWIDASGAKKCRWCNAFQINFRCSCGGSDLTPGRAGATRTASELGRAFPSARVIESTGLVRTTRIARGRTLVIATAGAEPYVDGGYSAVVLLDAKVALSRQNLRAQEEAVRAWANAVAKSGPKAPSVLVGVSGELSQLFSLWNHQKIAESEYKSRQELGLPPALRLGSITGEASLMSELSEILAKEPSVVRIGPAPVGISSTGQQWRLIFKYPYSIGLQLAKMLKVEVARISAGKLRTSSSGRSARAITVKMNDPEVV
jgi:primosomal protein N' (replication factor Y)